MAKIGREFYSGDLATVLRNMVDEFAIRHQSGSGTIASGTTAITITLPNEMPDTDYQVFVTAKENGTADNQLIYVDPAGSKQLTTSFEVECKVNPGGSNLDFSWYARHNARLNSKTAVALKTHIPQEFYSENLATVLRKITDELNVKSQAGTGTIANGDTSVAVTLAEAMPNTDYDVFITGTGSTTNDPEEVFTTSKTTTAFTVNCGADPGNGGFTFAYLARHRTRSLSKLQ